MHVLGIETSCDETGLAIVAADKSLNARIVSEALFSQAKMHQPYGGVVPELAARDHIVRLIPLLEAVQSRLSLDAIDAIAYTAGPGLIAPLMSGAVFGQALALFLGRPAIGIHHMEAHLLSPLLSEAKPALPFIALLVSGGHTQLVLAHALGRYELLGESLDDAAGEAFDKTARLLGLSYPGGAEIAKLAAKGRPGRYVLPRPMTKRPGLNFSFSGLKTHAATLFAASVNTDDEQMRADFALAFEEAITDTLAIKCRRALAQTGVRTLVVAGGVSANQRLREKLSALEKHGEHAVFFPKLSLCTDNGTMIAHAGLLRLASGEAPSACPEVYPRWPLTDLSPFAPVKDAR